MAARGPLVVSAVVAMSLLVAGCGEDDEDPSSAGTSAGSGSSQAAGEVAHSAEPVDIGGRELYLECWGEPVADESTVLLISGSGPTTSYWGTMATDFAADGHHLCGYDRAGVGGSDFAPELRRTTQDLVTDLVALLDAAELQEPVVVVAHSLGSLPAVGLVDRVPERVAGVVLVDPVSPRIGAVQEAALPPKERNESPDVTDERLFLTDFRYDPSQNPEHLVVAASEAEAARLLDEPGPLFGDLPVVVLQAPLPELLPGLPRGYVATAHAAIADGNKELAAESTRGTVVRVEDTGHNIHEDQPRVVIDAIRDVMGE